MLIKQSDKNPYDEEEKLSSSFLAMIFGVPAFMLVLFGLAYAVL